MKLGTVIKLPEGRIGTICWHNLDGYGGVWGVGVDLNTQPEFMLREKAVEGLLRTQFARGYSLRPDVECVGEEFKVVTLVDADKPIEQLNAQVQYLEFWHQVARGVKE